MKKELDLGFINKIRQNTETAIKNKEEHKINEKIIANINTGKFKKFLKEIELASEQGLYMLTYANAPMINDEKITRLDLECLEHMGFCINLLSNRSTGEFTFIEISWKEGKDGK